MESQPSPQPRYEITLEELYQIIGELEVVRRKLVQQMQANSPVENVPPQPPQR
jgi:hypothetical protein